MSDAGWYPGPWHVSHSAPDASVRNGEKPVAVIAANGYSIASNTTYYPTALEARNANLIASAPDLYEALREAADLCVGTFAEGGTPHKRMLAALAKARGE